MADIQDFSGVWRAYHWYPSRDDSHEASDEYELTLHQKGPDLVFQSQSAKDAPYIFIRLRVDANVATGTWHETASPDGDFAGAMYSGAGQLVISEDSRRMEGMWAGMGVDHKTDKPRIYTGRWELVRTDA